jgi:FixJ family two-component response regulator
MPLTCSAKLVTMRGESEKAAVVCIIDDDPIVRDGLSNLLRSIGLQVDVFGSATEFLGKERPSAPCCLVLDVRMPGVSGLDFQAELAKRNIDLPIIFLTGYGDIPMSVKAIKAGAVEFLTKPFREQDLLDAVRIALDRDRDRRRNDGVASDVRARFESLTTREREVVALVSKGRLNKQAAAEIGISEITVKVHRHNAMQKLGAKSLVDLIRMADTLAVRSDK